MIKTLIDRGHAYPAEDGSGDVYFDVRSWPAYGSLSGQKIDEMEAAGDADPRGKRDPRDFALWKGHKDSEPTTASWFTPWGWGRPGWHLECSAMAGKYLGDEFDIHGGGLDLRFPHHENELAQSTAAGRALRPLLDAQRPAHRGRGEDEQISRQRCPRLRGDQEIPGPCRAPLPRPAALPLDSRFSDAALAESVTALTRIDNFVTRAAELVARPRPRAPRLPRRHER